MLDDSPRQIASTLEAMGVKLKHRWGQNFLINPNARLRILKLIDPGPSDRLWEVGGGLGGLTALLLDRARSVVVFELDRGLVRFLKERFREKPGLSLVPGDVLRTWRKALEERGPPDQVVGNLPYSCASALIVSFIEAGFKPPRMVFTVQREMARRMTAAPSTANYSSFSVLCQTAFSMEERFQLQAGSFYPAPEVVSTVIEMKSLAAAGMPSDRALFLRLVRALFFSRRKTVRNNLLAKGGAGIGLPPEVVLRALEEERIDPGARGETLAPESLVRLADRLHRAIDR